MARRNQTSERTSIPTLKRTVKKGFLLSPDANKKLETAALVEEKDQSEIVDTLILTHLTGYYSGRRGHGEDVDGKGGVNLAVETIGVVPGEEGPAAPELQQGRGDRGKAKGSQESRRAG
jgi:hypothetical protein